MRSLPRDQLRGKVAGTMTSTDTAAVDRTSSPTFADDAPSQHRDASLELIFDERCQVVV